MKSESEAHLQLKKLALGWARMKGFSIAAQEVSLPQFRFRLDAAAYQPVGWTGQKLRKLYAQGKPMLGATVIFECKQARQDFLRDSQDESRTAQVLERLHERKRLYDQELGRHFPSLRNGDSLFPEFESYRIEEAGYVPYTKLLARIQTLSARLHHQTKFDKLRRWATANLHYVVAEPGVAKPHELPSGWGLLVRQENELVCTEEPLWMDVPEETRLVLLQRIAATQARLR
jgi:hypothetical protein